MRAQHLAERLSRGLGSERAATAAADITAAQLLLVLVTGAIGCMRPRRPRGASKSEVPSLAISFWWLWPVATGAAAAMMTAVVEQQLQRGVPTMVGVIGGLIIGGVEAALMIRRSRGPISAGAA
jgi:hypothetical protein